MEDDGIERLIQSTNRLLVTVMVTGGLLVLTMAGLIFSIFARDTAQSAQGASTVTQSPRITNTVQVPDEIAKIQRMAESRKGYYRSEFSKITGYSEREIDRWRESGDIPSYKDDRGRVIIPLDAVPPK